MARNSCEGTLNVIEITIFFLPSKARTQPDDEKQYLQEIHHDRCLLFDCPFRNFQEEKVFRLDEGGLGKIIQ